MESIKVQSNQDFEQIIINDEVGHGLLWANSQIYANSHRALGTYVYVLDDDDFLVSKQFVSDLQEISERHDPDVIITKGYIGEKLYPLPGFWKKNLAVRGTIGSPNFIVKNDLFQRHSKHWCKDKAGDFFFISQVMQDQPLIHWWDNVSFIASIGNGQPEELWESIHRQ